MDVPNPFNRTEPVRVTVWNEFIHERRDSPTNKLYPAGLHTAVGSGIKRYLGEAAIVNYATLEEPEHGLSDMVLERTDVLMWWGHTAHDAVADSVVDRVATKVLRGMGLIAMHSAHEAKIFRKLMGTSCSLRWRNEQDRELIWTVRPGHPICDGVPSPIILPQHEMYGEYFDIPQPDELLFISSFSGGEVFRSGICYERGRGRIFYFSPGDQAYPIFHNEAILRVLANAVAWAAPSRSRRNEPLSARAERGWYEMV